MDNRRKDLINSCCIFVAGFLCLLVGGYSAAKRQLIETLVMLILSNILFSCGGTVFSRYHIEIRMKEYFDRMSDEIRRMDRNRKTD